jgi:hypothetical protein
MPLLIFVMVYLNIFNIWMTPIVVFWLGGCVTSTLSYYLDIMVISIVLNSYLMYFIHEGDIFDVFVSFLLKMALISYY